MHTYAYICIQTRTDAYKYIQLHTNARTVLTFVAVDRIWRDVAAWSSDGKLFRIDRTVCTRLGVSQSYSS